LILIVLIAVAGVSLWDGRFFPGDSARGMNRAPPKPSSQDECVAWRYPARHATQKNPVAASPEVISGAMKHFADHCAICHANDGSGKTLIGRGLYPKPPDMSQAATQELTDGELYYIIEKWHPPYRNAGIREEPAGMGDEESWALVAFIRHLPRITVEEVEAMKKMNSEKSGGAGERRKSSKVSGGRRWCNFRSHTRAPSLMKTCCRGGHRRCE